MKKKDISLLSFKYLDISSSAIPDRDDFDTKSHNKHFNNPADAMLKKNFHPTPAKGNGEYIYIADMHEDVADMINTMLTIYKYQPVRLMCPNDTLDIIRNLSIRMDILLLDIVFSDAQEIIDTAYQARPKLPIFLLSARGKSEEAVHNLESGKIDSIICKPFDIEAFMKTIKSKLPAPK